MLPLPFNRRLRFAVALLFNKLEQEMVEKDEPLWMAFLSEYTK